MGNKFFSHERAVVESSVIGDNTRIWAFAHVLPGATIGADCNICDHVFIENAVIVGNRVTIKSGVQLWDGVRLEDDVFVGPNVTFTNDNFPRSKQYPEGFQKTVVQAGASIGANATILSGIAIGRHAMVGAGAVVTKRVPPNAIVVGNPPGSPDTYRSIAGEGTPGSSRRRRRLKVCSRKSQGWSFCICRSFRICVEVSPIRRSYNSAILQTKGFVIFSILNFSRLNISSEPRSFLPNIFRAEHA